MISLELTKRGRTVTLLDGDSIRRILSSELGFSREHRDLNVRRIGYVAGQVVRHGGVSVIAAIAPFDAARRELRETVRQHGRFVLVYLSTPLEVCEKRDPKGSYAKARQGLIRYFTGVSDMYERPSDADLTIDTSRVDRQHAVEMILSRISTST